MLPGPWTLKPYKVYVYRAYDENGVILYVGQTTNFQRRRNDHRANSVWAPLAFHWQVDEHPNLWEANRSESQQIHTLRPRFNYQTTGMYGECTDPSLRTLAAAVPSPSRETEA